MEEPGSNWDGCTSGTNRKNTLSSQGLSVLSPYAQGEADLTFQLNAFLENIAIGRDPLGRDWSTPALCLKGNSGSQECRPDTDLMLWPDQEGWTHPEQEVEEEVGLDH